ncbi:MAG: outer membrane protein assembly factor BamA [Paracoccaceae bacterium]
MWGCGAKRRETARTLGKAVIFSVLVSGTWTASGQETVAQQFQFGSIQIEGNARIGDSAILSRAGIATGQTLSAGQVNDAVQRLQNSGLFESVEVIPSGNVLRIVVVELPTINRVRFEGNRRIDDEALSAIVESTERRVFSPAQAERDASNIAEAYSVEGRISARVAPRIIKRSDNRVDLVFEVFEGGVIEIERLSFVGNKAYSDRRLRRVLQTKQAGLFRTFVRTDTLVEDRIAFDRQVLQDFYFSRGYVDFRTLSTNAELAEERDGFFLVFNVQEGQQFQFGEITVTSEVDGVDADVYQSLIKARAGMVYSPTIVENEITRMENQSVRDGVDFLRVEPRISRNDRDLTLDVEFVLSRGPRVFVERIDIEGNTTTLDRVIRRQFDEAEGDPFNPRRVRQAAERIRALDFFEVADVNAREGSRPDQVIVDVDVEEKPTGSLSFGASFSRDDGPGVAVSFAERNFLGRGQTLNLSFTTAADSEVYGINFIEPKLLGRDVAFGLRLNYAQTDSRFLTYETEGLVVSPSLTFPISEAGRLQLRYTYEDVEMTTLDTATFDGTGDIINEEVGRGSLSSSSLGYTYSYDSRRNGLNPDAGWLFEFSQDFGGIGGDNEFLKSTAKVSGQRLAFNEEVTLRATLEGGHLAWRDGDSRGVDRFLLDPSIIRGFEPGGIGPRDAGTTDDALGGNIYVAARVEAEFPLGLPEELGIRGALFYDVGNLWDLDDANPTNAAVLGEGGSFRHVIGFSILWDTAIGPLRFNFTEALVAEDFDKERSFDLTLSTRF